MKRWKRAAVAMASAAVMGGAGTAAAAPGPVSPAQARSAATCTYHLVIEAVNVRVKPSSSAPLYTVAPKGSKLCVSRKVTGGVYAACKVKSNQWAELPSTGKAKLPSRYVVSACLK